MNTNSMPAELIIVDNDADNFGAFRNWTELQASYEHGYFEIGEEDLAIKNRFIFHPAKLIAQATDGGAYYRAGDRCYHVSDNFFDGRIPQPADIERCDLAEEIAAGNINN